jgi:hypothetical protein
MVALLLVVGFATVMTTVDENASYETVNKVAFAEDDIIFGSSASYNLAGTMTWISPDVLKDSVFLPSDTGGSYMIDYGVTGFTSSSFSISNVFLTNDVQKVVVYTDHDLSYVRLDVNNSGSPSFPYKQYWLTQTSPGVWEKEFAFSEILQNRHYTSSSITFGHKAATTSSIVEFDVEFWGSPVPVYYASTLAFIFGLVLIITALFATPFLSKDKIRVFYVNNRQRRHDKREKKKRMKKELM